MISLHRSMHSSQMYTPGPAMSFLTCFWLFPQKEHLSRSPPSPIRATGGHPPVQYRHCGKPLDGTPSLPRTGAGHEELDVGSAGDGRGALEGLEHVVDQAVLDRLLGGQDLVTLDVVADLLDAATAVVADHLLEQLTHPEDLVGLDLDVGGLAERALGVGLVDEDPAVGERQALALGAGRQQDRRGRGGLADAHGLHVALDEAHRVVDRGQRGERAARAVDVDADVLVGVHRLQAHELGDHRVRDVVRDRRAEVDDALLEQLAVGVDAAEAVGRALFPLGDVVVHVQSFWWAGRPSSAASRALLMTWSTRPYSRACSAVNQRSRSASASTCSRLWPVCSAIRSSSTCLMCSDCWAWILMSEAEPPMPDEGWCIMIRACGSA